MTGHSPLAGQSQSAEIWQSLLRETILYATNPVNRWPWRSAMVSILPDAFAPENPPRNNNASDDLPDP